MFFRQKKLSTKIVLLLVTAAFFSFLVVSSATYLIVRNLTIDGQKQKAALLIDTIAPSVSLNLYLGTENIDERLASLTQLKEVFELSVFKEDGTLYYHYRQTQNDRFFEPVELIKPVFEPSSSVRVGTIRLRYGDNAFVETLHHFYVLYAFAFIFTFLLLWGLLYWINALLSPIKEIARAAELYSPGEIIEFDLSNEQEEFVSIASAFDTMQHRVFEYAEEIESMNKVLENKVEEKTSEALQRLYFDNLTSLPNRLKLQEDLAKIASGSVAILNIDDFKEINDFFGIDLGDDLLRQLSSWIGGLNLHPYRIGGDEFAFMLPTGSGKKELAHQMEMLLSLLNEKHFTISGENVHLRATIGIAIHSDKPLIHADVALNKARLHKLPYSFYDPEEKIEEQYKTNIAISTEIRQALLEHRIVCQYQPIVSCSDGTIKKYEALVRIQMPDGTLLPPNLFLPIAHKTKLYRLITHEVVYQTCHLFANRPESFSINLSISDILDSKTADFIEQTLKETQTAQRVIFEILESEGIENFDKVALFISRFKNLGARFAIDDFGTGYSNYENILNLNIDILKIDGSLIRSIATNTRHRIVIEAIVDFADRIGIETVAEFVADAEIRDYVCNLGIDYAQGYFIGVPQYLNDPNQP